MVKKQMVEIYSKRIDRIAIYPGELEFTDVEVK